jgi:hypothetical protein
VEKSGETNKGKFCGKTESVLSDIENVITDEATKRPPISKYSVFILILANKKGCPFWAASIIYSIY